MSAEIGDRAVWAGSREPARRAFSWSRHVAGVLVLCAVGLVALGHAASLGGLVSSGLGAAKTFVAACDTDGLTTSFAMSGSTVTSVTVGGVDDPCEGDRLQLTVTDTGGTSLATGGPQTIPTDADALEASVTVSLAPQPTASRVTNIHVAILEP